jgi:transcriptional regulator with XRE-family HTH domain
MTQQALADATGLKQSAIARLEVGETPPSLHTLAKLSRATGLEFNLDIANGDVAMPEDTPSDTSMSGFRFQWSLLVQCKTGEQLTADELGDQAEQLLGELVKLERCNPSMADPDTSFDASEGSVTVEMDIAAVDEPEAARLALQICRSAIHAIGGATAEWPSESDAERGADFRPQRMGFAYSSIR